MCIAEVRLCLHTLASYLESFCVCCESKQLRAVVVRFYTVLSPNKNALIPPRKESPATRHQPLYLLTWSTHHLWQDGQAPFVQRWRAVLPSREVEGWGHPGEGRGEDAIVRPMEVWRKGRRHPGREAEADGRMQLQHERGHMSFSICSEAVS